MTRASITASGIAKRFGDKVVLDGVDVRVEPGSIFGYIGPNGAGKTTTAKILLGMLPDFEGEVRVAGFDPRVEPVEVKRRVGYLPETAIVYEALTVAEFLLMLGRLHELADDVIRRRAEAFLDVLELRDRLGSRLITLSKGMRQKVLLTASVLHEPEILFVDEPLSGLDVASAILVREFFRRYADAGRAVFYCSHVMDVVERVCDKIAILSGGKIAAEGSFAELSARLQESSLEAVFGKVNQARDPATAASRMLEALE